MQRIRVSGAFVTKFNQEWKRCGDTMLNSYSGPTQGEHHQRVERFLEAMAPELARVLKHELLACLLADAAAVENSKLALDTVPAKCDSVSPCHD